VAVTSAVPGLVFPNKFVEVLDKTYKDHQRRPRQPDEEEPGNYGHDAKSETNHNGILNHSRQQHIATQSEAFPQAFLTVSNQDRTTT
jgi:hypothetical protein